MFFRIVRARSAKQSDIILRLLLLQVCICILKKAPYDYQDDKSNRKSSYNGNRLKTAHGVFREDQGNREKHQGNSPEQFYLLIRFFVCIQRAVRIGACNHG